MSFGVQLFPWMFIFNYLDYSFYCYWNQKGSFEENTKKADIIRIVLCL